MTFYLGDPNFGFVLSYCLQTLQSDCEHTNYTTHMWIDNISVFQMYIQNQFSLGVLNHWNRTDSFIQWSRTIYTLVLFLDFGELSTEIAHLNAVCWQILYVLKFWFLGRRIVSWEEF